MLPTGDTIRGAIGWPGSDRQAAGSPPAARRSLPGRPRRFPGPGERRGSEGVVEPRMAGCHRGVLSRGRCRRSAVARPPSATAAFCYGPPSMPPAHARARAHAHDEDKD